MKMKIKNVYLKPPLPFVPTTTKHSLIICTLNFGDCCYLVFKSFKKSFSRGLNLPCSVLHCLQGSHSWLHLVRLIFMTTLIIYGSKGIIWKCLLCSNTREIFLKYFKRKKQQCPKLKERHTTQSNAFTATHVVFLCIPATLNSLACGIYFSFLDHFQQKNQWASFIWCHAIHLLLIW